jgi:hypothetical protein
MFVGFYSMIMILRYQIACDKAEKENEQLKHNLNVEIRISDIAKQKNRINEEIIKVHNKHWNNLADRILEEIGKDGWCRLAISEEEALEMKRMFGIDETEEEQ